MGGTRSWPALWGTGSCGQLKQTQLQPEKPLTYPHTAAGWEGGWEQKYMAEINGIQKNHVYGEKAYKDQIKGDPLKEKGKNTT